MTRASPYPTSPQNSLHPVLGEMLKRPGGLTLEEAVARADDALKSCGSEAQDRVVALARTLAEAATAPTRHPALTADRMLTQVEEIRILSESCGFSVLNACAELFFDYLMLAAPSAMERREVLWVFSQSLLLFATEYRHDEATTSAILGDLRGLLRRLLDGQS